MKTAMNNVSGGYKKLQQLVKLILFLEPEKFSFEEAESLVFDLAGAEALRQVDLKFCAQICQNIVAKGYQTGWTMFVELANDESSTLDYESKIASINYALSICPNDEIFNTLYIK